MFDVISLQIVDLHFRISSKLIKVSPLYFAGSFQVTFYAVVQLTAPLRIILVGLNKIINTKIQFLNELQSKQLFF